MALDAFGPAVDVQAGGADLRFPHHAYQAALAEALTGVTPFARARLQCAVVTTGGAKMAKSAGNLVLVRDLLARYPAAAVRMLILDRQWATDWDYDPRELESAAARVERLRAAAARPPRGAPGSGDAARAAVASALARDLDVPAALEIAEDAGGPAARELGTFLSLL
jgi:cysteinyl-tRNA synthetase